MALSKLLLNGTEYSFGGSSGTSGADYKTSDQTTWVFTLTAGTTLTSTRTKASGESTISGYTTYLIPNANIPVGTGFVKVSGTTYWIGYYTDGGSRTYTAASGAYYANNSYTGIAICMQDSNGDLDDVSFMYRMQVITTHRTPIDLPGFSGYDTNEYLTIVGNGGSRPQVYLPVDSDKVYAIRFSEFTYYQMCAVKTGTTNFSITSQAAYAVMGDYVIIASIDGYLSWTMANNEGVAALYNADGLEVYVFDAPWELKAIRDSVPCRALIHGGNYKHQVLLAYALGWRGVETDVRKTSDGEFILCHNPSLGGLTIADSTYADILDAYPGVMTVDELIDISSYFECMIDYHFQSISADDRWALLVRGLQRNIDHLGYYTGITGYIGTEDANTFYENGIVYGYSDSMDVPSTVAAAKYYIGEAGSNTTDDPQIAFILPGTADTGTPTNTELRSTLKGYFSDITYLSKYYPLYDAPCRKLELDSSTLTFTSTGTKKLYPTPDPIYCSEDITWMSSDTSVVTVATSSSINTLFPYATVTAVASGTATITATCGDASVTCEVTVSI